MLFYLQKKYWYGRSYFFSILSPVSIWQWTVDKNGQLVQSKNGHAVIENASHRQYVCLLNAVLRA